LEKPSQSSKQFVQIPEEPKSFLKKEQILSNILPNHSNIFIKRSQNRFKNIRPDQSNMKQKHQTCIKKETPNFQTKQIIKSTWFRKFSPWTTRNYALVKYLRSDLSEEPDKGATLCHCWLFMKANLASKPRPSMAWPYRQRWFWYSFEAPLTSIWPT
jgi:hypothetical protein